MSRLLHLGEIIAMNARHYPDKRGGRDLTRSMTFRQWNDRAPAGLRMFDRLGLEKAIGSPLLAYNCLEGWTIYAAVAKAG